MTRLEREVQRLFLTDAAAPGLVDAAGQVRAAVLGLFRPADWAVLAPVWQGVQADLALPAPAIAVAGEGGYQLWFSFEAPVPVELARALLEALRRRYLGDVDLRRVTLWPAPDPAAAGQARHAPTVPALLAGSEHWSAFVAQDLAPVFGDEPWLDLPPNLEGQASLLARLVSIRSDDLPTTFERLRTAASAAAPTEAPPATAPAPLSPAPPRPVAGSPHGDPKAFLLAVMNDEAVALPLRIDAAKALLPHVDGPPRG